MGIQDRDWYRDAMREKAKQEQIDATKRKFERFSATQLSSKNRHTSPQRSLLLMLLFWLVVMAIVYAIMQKVLAPKRPQPSGNGTVEITRSTDGHFRTVGLVNGRETVFLIDTGASTVSVSDEFAARASLHGGTPTVFNTANGQRPGRMVNGISVSVGPLAVHNTTVGVGITSGLNQEALLGQSFLHHFDVVISGTTLVLRPRQ